MKRPGPRSDARPGPLKDAFENFFSSRLRDMQNSLHHAFEIEQAGAVRASI